MVPVVKACDYELNNRRYNRKTDKTTILQQEVVQRLCQKVINDSIQKEEQRKIKERSQIIMHEPSKEDEVRESAVI